MAKDYTICIGTVGQGLWHSALGGSLRLRAPCDQTLLLKPSHDHSAAAYFRT